MKVTATYLWDLEEQNEERITDLIDISDKAWDEFVDLLATSPYLNVFLECCDQYATLADIRNDPNGAYRDYAQTISCMNNPTMYYRNMALYEFLYPAILDLLAQAINNNP